MANLYTSSHNICDVNQKDTLAVICRNNHNRYLKLSLERYEHGISMVCVLLDNLDPIKDFE